jgi:Holliday junction DNA helicase RuvA
MIALISGTVAVRRADHVVVDCGGVGYRLAVSAQTLRRVGAVGSQVRLHAHTMLREDQITLYGFASEQERELFVMLLGVQSVGPKVALAVLSSAPTGELVALLAGGDAARLQSVPGVGKRTAQRIIVELRERIGAASTRGGAPVGVAAEEQDPRGLARQALLGLGYSQAEAVTMLEGASGERPEELIASALRGVGR